MKVVQLNCWEFAFEEEIMDFLKDQKPNIVNLQEVTTTYLPKNVDYNKDSFLCRLGSELKMKVIFAPTSGNLDKNGNIKWNGNAILTNLEILDYQIIWDKYNHNHPKIRTFEENVEIERLCKINKNLAYPFVFDDPKNTIYTTLICPNGTKFRNITTQFTVSQMCTETIQMIRQAQQIIKFLNNSLDMPTILTGDLNIERGSGIIHTLEQKFEIVNDPRPTLNPQVHSSILRNPNWQGVSVDYIFAKEIKATNYQLHTEKLSDHLCLVAEFEI